VGRLELTLWRGDVRLRDASTEVAIAPARRDLSSPRAALFDGWIDLSYAYRFGPPAADVGPRAGCASTTTLSRRTGSRRDSPPRASRTSGSR